MRLLQKISAGVLITFGLVFTVALIADIANPKADNKSGALGALILVGFAPTAAGGFLIRNVLNNERKEREALGSQESDRLQSIFYLLLKKHNGELNPVLFAMETKLSPAEAKAYLDQKAKEFEANFEVSDRGDITYQFNVGKKSTGQE